MTRMAWVSNAAVLLLLITFAAFLQDKAPPLLWGRVKPPFLTAVAVYYCVRRPLGLAAVACVWAGLMLDGLGDSRLAGIGTTTLIWFFLFSAVWVRRQMSENMLSCVVLCAGAAMSQTFLQSFKLLQWHSEAGMLAQASGFLLRTSLTGLLALPTAALTVLVADALDSFASNIKTEAHGDGFDWSAGGR